VPALNLVFIRAALVLCLCLAPNLVRADDFQLLRAQMSATRGALIDLMTKPELRSPEQLASLIQLVEQVNSRLATLTVPHAKRAALSELRDAWWAYQSVLVSEVIPALRSGQDVLATRLASGVLRGRLTIAFRHLNTLRTDPT
jgi:hypothetical protein